MAALVQMKKIVKRFGAQVVLDEIDMEIARGEVVVAMGPSGAGKSTLLRCVNGLEEIDGGTIDIDGTRLVQRQRDLNRMRQHIGMVFQQFNLFPHLTVEKNVVMAQREVLGRSRGDSRDRARELLDRVGLADKAPFFPERLSGGEQQRVAIARALAMDPKLMLFDEPTSALDPELVGEVLRTMHGLASRGMTMLVVSHERRFARQAADRIVLMSDGNIAEEGTPDQVLDNPQSERGKAFLAEVADG